ncbi:MAG: radical SAM protein, partial [Moorella sp. (in: Bacteria)]|nr:radical SAM protein [Moorella sp. (in: firmicutes)]
NLRRPCPLIDNPEMLREIVEEAGARSTQLHDKETAAEFAAKLAPYARAWGEVADQIWTAEGKAGAPVTEGKRCCQIH